DDGAADPAIAADINAVEQNRILHQCITVDADIGRENAPTHVAAADDTSLADHAIMRLTATRVLAIAFVEEDKLGGRQLRLVGSDRPLAIVQVQDWIDLDQVHVRLVIGIQRADIAPVGDRLAVLVTKAKNVDFFALNHAWDNILAEVVIALRMGGILA